MSKMVGGLHLCALPCTNFQHIENCISIHLLHNIDAKRCACCALQASSALPLLGLTVHQAHIPAPCTSWWMVQR